MRPAPRLGDIMYSFAGGAMGVNKVLMTGAAGYIASQLLPTFAEQYEMVLVDVSDTNRDGNKVPGVNVVDLVDSDRSGYEALFEGVDAVVHLGYKRRSGAAVDHFSYENDNVAMAYNVMRSAYDAGVPRVTVASSNHAADWYEHFLIHERKMEVLDPYALALSDNFYGWAKATYEHIGFLFACGFPGDPDTIVEAAPGVNASARRRLEVVMVRIGAPREINVEQFKDNPAGFKRDLGAYISQRDITQLFQKSIETPDIENEHGVPWQVVYGISNNTRAFWSLTSARSALDYEPQDDSEVKYADEIRGFLTGDDPAGGVGRVGLS